MITATNQAQRRYWYGAMVLLLASLLSGCSMLLPAKSPPPTLYSFDSSELMIEKQPAKRGAPTLIVSIPHAASGFDSQQIVYIRQLHTFEYFQQSQWVDTPAAMLLPLMVTALEGSGQFGAVIQAPTSAVGQLRLDVEIIRLQHEFLKIPGSVHFTMRAYLLDTATRKILDWRQFDAIVPSASEDPYGGVLAASSAVRTVIEQLVLFCGQTAGNLPKMPP